MRVNPDYRSGLLAALERTTETQDKVLKQLSSGRKIQTPSDDPAGTAALIEVQAGDSQTQQFVANISAMRTRMSAADSALNSVSIALQRAATLGVEGATGTLSDSDRQALATELSGIQEQLIELANSSLSGVYLFSGTEVTTKPYVSDATTPAGIHYQGNSTTNQVEIGQGYWIRANLPGSSIFGDDNTGVFKAMADLITAVKNNNGVEVANTAVSAMREQVSAARVQYGNAMNQIDSTEKIMRDRHVQFQQQVNDLAAVDMARAASDLVSTEISRNALLEVIAKSNGLSLFDYLK
jgi:flagellar hook-associated protein 3 FlgL